MTLITIGQGMTPFVGGISGALNPSSPHGPTNVFSVI